MATARQSSSSSSANLLKGRSRILLLFILSVTALLYILSVSSSSYSSHSISLRPSNDVVAAVDYSFVASLEKFLSSGQQPPRRPSSTAAELKDDDVVSKLDDSKWENENRRMYRDPHYPASLPIRVYVYDMPNKFTYDLLSLFIHTYKDTSNLTSNGSPVHRLIEQHSIDYWLWADLIAPESERLLKDVVVRVDRQDEADLFYIPFFTTISFFLLEKQQCKALYRVKL